MKIRDNLQYHHDLDVLAGLQEPAVRDLQHFVHATADHRTAHAVQATMLHKLRESVDLGYLSPEFAEAVEAVVEMDGSIAQVAYRFKHQYHDARQCNVELRGVVENTLSQKQPTSAVVQVLYDKQADVLYLSLGKPQPCFSREAIPGVLLRSVDPYGKVIGVTIIDFLGWYCCRALVAELPPGVHRVLGDVIQSLNLDPRQVMQYTAGGEVLA
jgi:uncharacterized protein YuzE